MSIKDFKGWFKKARIPDVELEVVIPIDDYDLMYYAMVPYHLDMAGRSLDAYHVYVERAELTLIEDEEYKMAMAEGIDVPHTLSADDLSYEQLEMVEAEVGEYIESEYEMTPTSSLVNAPPLSAISGFKGWVRGQKDVTTAMVMKLHREGKDVHAISSATVLAPEVVRATIRMAQMIGWIKKAQNDILGEDGYVWNIGQLDKDTLKELNKGVRKNTIKKTKARWPYYDSGPSEKTIYYRANMDENDLIAVMRERRKWSSKSSIVSFKHWVKKAQKEDKEFWTGFEKRRERSQDKILKNEMGMEYNTIIQAYQDTGSIGGAADKTGIDKVTVNKVIDDWMGNKVEAKNKEDGDPIENTIPKLKKLHAQTDKKPSLRLSEFIAKQREAKRN